MPLIVDDLARMRMLVAGVYLGVAISSTYGFSIFTEPLKSRYGMSQSDITTISTVGNCVGYCSFLAGMLFDFAGPMVVMQIAGFLGFFGFFLFGLTFAGVIPNPSVAVFSVFNAILYLGCPALDVSGIMPLMLQFPLDRGYVVLIQKTFSGLGTSILMTYFNGWFKSSSGDGSGEPNYAAYAYFIGVQIWVCALFGTLVVRLPMYFPCAWRRKRLSEEELTERKGTLDLYMKQPAPTRRLMTGFAIVLIVLIFCTTQSLVTAYTSTSRVGYIVISVFAVLLMASFTVMALPFQFLGRYTPVRRTSMDTIGEVAEKDSDAAAGGEREGESFAASADGDEAGGAVEAVTPAPQYQGSFWRHLLTVDLWCLWLACFGMWGTGTVMQMNAAQIYRSKNQGVVHIPTLTLYVTMMSVGSAVGRMSVGFLDMKLAQMQRAKKTQILTTIAMPICPLLLVAAYLLFAVLPQNGLIVPFFLGSVGNGAAWSVGVLGVRMMYAQDLGKHYNFCFTSGLVSTIALNRFMFGGMYDREAHKRGQFPNCNEPGCVTNQMWILMGVNILATLAAFVVHWRFSRFTAANAHKAEEECEKCEEPINAQEN